MVSYKCSLKPIHFQTRSEVHCPHELVLSALAVATFSPLLAKLREFALAPRVCSFPSKRSVLTWWLMSVPLALTSTDFSVLPRYFFIMDPWNHWGCFLGLNGIIYDNMEYCWESEYHWIIDIMSHLLWSNKEKPTININHTKFLVYCSYPDWEWYFYWTRVWLLDGLWCFFAAMRHIPKFHPISPIFGGIHVNMFRVWYVKTHFSLEARDETPEYGRSHEKKVATTWKAIGFGGTVCDIGLSLLPPARDILAM